MVITIKREKKEKAGKRDKERKMEQFLSLLSHNPIIHSSACIMNIWFFTLECIFVL